MKSIPINLEVAYGDRFRIRMSEDHEPGHPRDPWNFEIPCKRWGAAVYPHGGSRLQARIQTGHLKPALVRLASAGCLPHQIGQEEATVIFDQKRAEDVFSILGPHKKAKGMSADFMASIRPTEKTV